MANDPTVSLEQLVSELPEYARVLGLDLGTKTIGMALSDVSRTVATPLSTIKRTKFKADAEELFATIDEHEIAGLILGMPVNLDGTEGPRAQSTRSFARNISQLREIPIVLWDERLSTVAAERTLLEADASRKRRSEVIDKMAAGFILQGALDRMKAL
ncbi:MAG: Holliday junction resolvase RuvX [Methyloligellaceae bacterium]